MKNGVNKLDLRVNPYLSCVSLCLAPLRPLPFPGLFISVDGSRRRSREAKRREEVTCILCPAGIVFSVRRTGERQDFWN